MVSSEETTLVLNVGRKAFLHIQDVVVILNRKEYKGKVI